MVVKLSLFEKWVQAIDASAHWYMQLREVEEIELVGKIKSEK